MGRRAAVLVLVLIALGGGAFLLRSALRSDEASGSRGIARDDAAASPQQLSPGDEEEGFDPGAVEPASAARTGARDSAAVPSAGALGRAVWIEGRVDAPLASPPDDTLAVIALPRTEAPPEETDPGPTWWKDAVEDVEGWTRTPVAPDGSFRAPLPEGTRYAALLVDGRFLHSIGTQVVPCEGGARGVVLEPALGACIELRCSPPPAAEDGAAELVGTQVELAGAPAGGGFFGFGAGGMQRELELGESLVLELRGLPADYRYFLSADPQVFASERVFDIDVEAGRVTRHELAFALGARLRGQVVDRAGEPVEGAEVEVEFQGQLARFAGGADREAKTDAEGRFVLRGVRPRRLVAVARLDGWIGARSDELSPRDGEEVSGLRLVLDRGLSIAGAVRFADGEPAPGAILRLVPSEGPPRGNREIRGEADEAGAFEVSGLENVAYDVYASGAAPDADPGDEEAEETGSRRGWRARSAKVPAGTSGLALTLTAPAGLAGRVVGPDGEPVADFDVSARLEESELARSGRASAKVADGDGRFLLEGAFDGEWIVTVEAEGMVTAKEEIRAIVPTGEELRIEMALAAGLEGVVVGPGGAPAAGADVRLSKGDVRRMGPGAGFGFGGPNAETDAEGRFALHDLRPGSWRVTASDETFAPSEPTTVQLAGGTVTRDFVVSLRVGGTLTGEIYDAAGAPEAGRTILANSMGAGAAKSGTSDAAGRFVIEHLAPGQYMVMAQPDLGRLSELEEQDEELDPADFMASMKMTSCEIVDGETSHVVLGAPPKSPVRLHGRVTEAGEPVTEGTVMVVAEGRSLLDAWKTTRVRTDGTYELVLDEPGNVLVTYQARTFQGSSIEYFERVPEAEEHRLDLELPAGRIAGVVVGPDGAPVADQVVTIEREDGSTGVSMMGGQNGKTTGEDGRFEFEHLRPSRYTLRAGNSFFGDASYGAAVVSGVAVGEGERVEVRLELDRPGAVVGRVTTAEGEPVSGATIFVRDASGALVATFSGTSTDADGRFRSGGLSPGQYTVCARAEELASPEVGPVRVREGDETEVELRLEEGTMLRVSAEDGEGEPVRVSISVRDEEGRELATLRSFASMQSMFSEGFSTSEQRIGPLPPGTYEVVATTSDGRSEKRTLKLSGRAERKLRLRIGDE